MSPLGPSTWPPMHRPALTYFVMDSTTRSAPCARGLKRQPVSQVLSHTKMQP